jgi:hypothetical protein
MTVAPSCCNLTLFSCELDRQRNALLPTTWIIYIAARNKVPRQPHIACFALNDATIMLLGDIDQIRTPLDASRVALRWRMATGLVFISRVLEG